MTPGPDAAWALLAAVVGLVALATVLDRTGSRPVTLGAVAGCLFASVTVAARLVPTDAGVAGFVTSPAPWTLGAAGLGAFVVYSVALQQGRVARVTAPLVALQTIVPSVVGVLWLGDTVRDGWAAAAVLGLAVTLAGAIALGRFEATGREPASA